MSRARASAVVRGACPHDCPDTCAWQVTVEDGVAVRLAGDPDHPFTRGTLCAKVNHFLDRVYSPDRILHPLRRAGSKGEGKFERVTWDEALDGVADALRRIIETDGATAILPYSYYGTQGLIQATGMDRRFFARLGASRLERNVCTAAARAGIAVTMGNRPGMLPEDIVHSRFIILWGTNTIVTNLHLWPFIREAREAGATLVVIDPVKTRTATAANWHLRPMPGTDAALALGMMHVIVAEHLYDADYVARHTVGFDRLRARLAEYPSERVAQITGLDAAEIIRLARAYATTRPAVIRPLVGMEHRTHGAMAFRTIACLPALVGAWRDRGGGLLHMTHRLHFQALNAAAVEMPELQQPGVRAINMVQLGRVLTDPDLRPPIRALIVYNSNPAAIAPNQNLVLQGLRRDDLFTVVLEQFLTDTARHADYVLPVTTQVEHWDLNWSWGHTYLTLNRPAIAPCGEALPNSEIFRRLAQRMGFHDPCYRETDEEMIRKALDSRHPYLHGITFERIMQDGWASLSLPEDYRPFADGGFATPSGKVEFYAESVAAQGLDPLPAYVPARESPAGDPVLAARYPLALIAAKSGLHFLNSTYVNLPRHRRAEGEPLLDLHPEDAASRGIRDGARVRVFNDRGSVEVRARIGDRVRSGVVAMPSGWWASLSPGGSSANALTSDGISDLGGGGDFHDTLVEVEQQHWTAARGSP
ncbi:MAG: molybdopterin oxidoreductase family protein [Armatimonadetes bacterium]|nr:molybdopterin oxidoreductase family protein [Armatimonadota bacterium]